MKLNNKLCGERHETFLAIQQVFNNDIIGSNDKFGVAREKLCVCHGEGYM